MKLYEFTSVKIKKKSYVGPVHLYTQVIVTEMNPTNNA